MKSLYSLLFVLLLISCGAPSPESDTQKLKAYSYAEEFVKQKLKSPSSAQFPVLDEKLGHVEYIGENKYKISSWVESKNSFGAMLKTPFEATIRFDEAGKVYSEAMTLRE